MHHHFSFRSFQEVDIQGVHWFRQDTAPEAVVVLSHGMAEKIERYHSFAENLVGHGIFVYGHDHRGHGKTALDLNSLGDFGENGWVKAREDLAQVVSMARQQYHDAPLFLLGHSMGSFLVRDLVHQRLKDYQGRDRKGKRYAPRDHWLPSGVMLSGTGFLPPATLTLGKWLAAMEVKWKGPLHRSTRLYHLSFGSYNKRIHRPRSFFDWLSRDPEQVDRYLKDPYCGAVHTSRFYWDFFHNLQRILYQEDGFKADSLPMLLLSGTEDPVSDYGEGVEKTKVFYDLRGFSTTMRLYHGGRHEMLNEINREEVFEDIAIWIKQCHVGLDA